MDVFIGRIEKTSRSLKVVEKIRQALAEGKLKIGDKLPNERELALQLGISRASLREAISIMSAYGILESKPGEGTYVTDKFAENMFEFLGFNNISNKENFRHLLHFRKILEVGSVDLIIENFNSEAEKELEELVFKFQKEEDINMAVTYDAEFHVALINYANNPIMVEIYKMIHKMLVSLIEILLKQTEVQLRASSDHMQILNYLRAKDSLSCKKAISEHLTNIEAFLEKYFT